MTFRRSSNSNFAVIILITLMLASRLIQAGEIKVACIGNSVTYGAGLQDPASESYPAQLQQLLGASYLVSNFGHSGATLLKNGHNPYYKTKEFEQALTFKPDIAIVHLGLNDTDPRNWPNYKDQFEADYNWLLDALKQVNPAIKLYVCMMTPIFSGHPRFKSGTFNWYWQVQQLLPNIAQVQKASLINLNEALHNQPNLFQDNLHPDREGAGIIAQTVYEKLTGNYGGLKLPAVFGDHMVLQRQKPIKIYGIANAAEIISVTFGKEKVTAQVDDNGCWMATFTPREAGGPFQLQVEGKDSTIVFNDILMGDVWLCSGQSNMDFPLRAAKLGDKLAQDVSNEASLRLYHLKGISPTDNEPWDLETLKKTNALTYFNGTWERASLTGAQDFSAIAYAFGVYLKAEIGVPIGLIQVAVGGSGIESWVDRYSLEKDPLLVDMLSGWRKSDFIMEWNRERADVNLKLAANPKQRHPYEPAYNFEAGIAPLKDFALKGVIWYQGESNVHNPELYGKLFSTFVSSWRQFFKQDTLPFYYVQLSSIDRPAWPYFRDLQRRLQKEIPNTWMAVSSDLGDSLNVHPIDKLPIGKRLANLALQHTYNSHIHADVPELRSIEQHGSQIKLHFANTKSLATNNHQQIIGFEYINLKGQIIPVNCTILQNIVSIELPEANSVREIRYAWQPFTRANLVNEQGIPVSTFSVRLKE